jgi:hypothetical protein
VTGASPLVRSAAPIGAALLLAVALVGVIAFPVAILSAP